MTCTELRQYIFAFLDNELDSALSMEVQQHIDHCPLCARECEIENVVRNQLADKLKEVDDVPAFDESALTQLLLPKLSPEAPSHSKHWPYGRLAVSGAVAAALLFAVTVFLRNPTTQTEDATLADTLVDDFDHFVTETKPLQIASADPQEVTDWLRDRTELSVSVPIVDPRIGMLMGGRKCEINGAPAAFAVYRMRNELVSVVALRGSEEALAAMERVDRNGHTHWVDHCRGHTVLACRRGELIYAIVSRLTQDELLPLMPPTEG